MLDKKQKYLQIALNSSFWIKTRV